MMNVLWCMIKHIFWFTAQAFYSALKGIWWNCNGVSKQLKEGEEDYTRSVHVQKIWLRYSFGKDPDGAEFPLTKRVFVTCHDRFEHPDYLLKPNVTLCCIDKNEALFVESEAGVDVLDSDNGGLVRMAQLRTARYLLRVSLSTLHRFADQIGDPQANIVFVLNTARCGSNIFGQVFEATGRYKVWSEPDALHVLGLMHENVDSVQFTRLARSVVRVLCKPSFPGTEVFFIKPVSPSMNITPALHQLFQNKAKFVFLYRDGLDQIKSLNRLANVFSFLKLCLMISHYGRAVLPFIMNIMSFPMPGTNLNIKSAAGIYTVAWARAMRLYLEFRKQGIPVSAIKYEHFKASPVESFRKIFAHLDLDFDQAAVENALSRDSTRGTVMSLENLNRNQSSDNLELVTDEILRDTWEVCDMFGLPRFPEPYEAPGTISKV